MCYPQIKIKNEMYSNGSAINTMPSIFLLPCYRLNVCVFPKFIYWNLPPPCDHSRRWDIKEILRVRGGYEGDSPYTGLLSSWGSQDTLLPLCSPPCEDIKRCWQSATQKRVLTRTPCCWHPDLTLAAPRTVTNKLLSPMSHPVPGTLSEQPALRHRAWHI